MVEGSSHVHSSSSRVAINMHGNYYYMVEGSPHVWLMCTVINVQGNNYYMVEGSSHVHGSSSHVAINVHGNYYYIV